MISDRNINLNISIENILKTQIPQPSDILTNNPLLDEMKSYGLTNFPEIEIDISSVFDISLCDNWNLGALSLQINNIITIYKQKIQDAKLLLEELKNNLQKEALKEMIKQLWQTIKDQFVQLYESILTRFMPVINYFKSTYRNIVILFKKLKSDRTDEEKKLIRQKIKNKLKEIGGDIIDMFNLYIIIDFIESSWKVIKNIFGAGKNLWKKIVNCNNNIKELLNENEADSRITKEFISIILPLISIIGKLGVIALAIIDCVKAQKELDEQLLNDSSIMNEYKSKSSLSNIITNRFIKNDKGDSSVVSICPVYDDSDANIIGQHNGYVIEIGNDIQDFFLYVNLNDDITLNQEIGNIKNIPIKSIVEGKVIDIKDRYMIIEKHNVDITPDDILNIEKDILNYDISNDPNSNEINEISDKLKDMNDIEILVKDYLDLLYEPILYGQCLLNDRIGALNTIDIEIIKVKNKHKKLKKELEDDIQKLCDKDNISNHAENDNLKELTDKILDKKYYVIDSIFNNIKQYENSKLFTVALTNNYKFCDCYMSFLLTKCENNKNYDNLYNLIKKFYIKRFKYEGNNISSLIKKFNKILKDDKIEDLSYEIILREFKDELTFNNVKKYISSKYTDETNENIVALSNLFILISDVKKTNKTQNSESLLTITKNEAVQLLEFINDINIKYNNYKNLLNDIDSCFNYANWPKPMDIYVDNVKYDHYLFVDDASNNYEEYGIQQNNIKYWQKYCGLATLINCATPYNWSTGIIIGGTPIMLPIILVPIKYIDGNISTLIGLGICGICIYPMVLIINNTDQFGSILMPINMLLDKAKELLKSMKDINFNTMTLSVKPMIAALNEKIKNTEDDIILIKKQISLYKNL